MFLHGVHNSVTIFQDRSNFHGSPADIVIQTVNRTAQLLVNYLNRFDKPININRILKF